jgi:hypothetical protein
MLKPTAGSASGLFRLARRDTLRRVSCGRPLQMQPVLKAAIPFSGDRARPIKAEENSQGRSQSDSSGAFPALSGFHGARSPERHRALRSRSCAGRRLTASVAARHTVRQSPSKSLGACGHMAWQEASIEREPRRTCQAAQSAAATASAPAGSFIGQVGSVAARHTASATSHERVTGPVGCCRFATTALVYSA